MFLPHRLFFWHSPFLMMLRKISTVLFRSELAWDRNEIKILNRVKIFTKSQRWSSYIIVKSILLCKNLVTWYWSLWCTNLIFPLKSWKAKHFPNTLSTKWVRQGLELDTAFKYFVKRTWLRSLNLFDIIILIPRETFRMCPISQLAYKYVSCITRVYHSPQLFTKKDWMCSIKPFDIIILTPRATLGMCCFHIAQLMTHTAIHTLLFTLQLCYKPLGIL